MAYRRRDGKDAWHSCKNCSTWPTSRYEEKPMKPTTGELCNEFRAKQELGTCQAG